MSAVGFGQIALVKLLFPSAHFAKKMGKCTKVESCGGKTRRATFLTVAFEKMHWRWAILWCQEERHDLISEGRDESRPLLMTVYSKTAFGY